MSFLDVVRRAKEHLQAQGRVSLRALRREFDLDADALEDLVEELVDVQRTATREGNVLVWGERPPILVPVAGDARGPSTYTPRHLADKIPRSRSARVTPRRAASR